MNVSINQNNLSSTLCITKVSIIIFISIIVYINLPKYWIDLNIKNNGEFTFYSSAILLTIIGIIILSCKISSYNIYQSLNKFRISWLLENIFFMAIISLPMYLFTKYEGEYKYLFLLLIVVSAMQYGSYYGMITSFVSSLSILGVDLLYAPIEDGINVYFQKDLILVGIFIFVALILGYYVDMELKNNKTKDDTLNMLSSELEEKDEQTKEMEALLLNNKICYDMLFENSLNAIIVHRNGIIIYANESAAKLLGYENSRNLNGKNLYNHYVADPELRLQKKYSYIAYNRLSKIIEEENILKCNGEFVPVVNTSSFFTYKGQPSIMTFLRDITSEKMVKSLQEDMEKQLKSLNESREFNNLVMNFFINMSHELKTPVNVIYSAIQTINIYFSNYQFENIDKCESYLKTIKQNCLRMIRIINNFLDITKLDYDFGLIKLNKRNGNIVSVIEEITQSVALYIKSKNISLIFDTDVEEKIMAFDYDMTERIMLNLISNALKYSYPKGHIYVNFEDKKTSVIIRVKDEGEGIPRDKLNVIFERFGQANNSLSRKCEGTGIGLYLVKSFVEMHGGKISVTSVESHGSEFTIELPVELVKTEDFKDKLLFKSNVEKIEIEFSDIYSITN
ncbi:sensor histidine kinase TmoS [Clostridium puniceum]|uniref:histidine kinase n=1 Tax=Clostridium puniceum TaxID=29367 RepID=A0A1S8T7N6_9CLOT|nr:PAS domain-containing sensor histidine kinase [Clostridium puniceum]OOM73672.1 sensor histidine kinase TmoS [Clostridium puniceum]